MVIVEDGRIRGRSFQGCSQRTSLVMPVEPRRHNPSAPEALGRLEGPARQGSLRLNLRMTWH
jgi:hypothetical protein